MSFLGYGSGVKGYKLWNPETRKTFMSRSIVFNESMMFTDSLTTYDALVEKLQPQVSVQVELMDDQKNEIIGNDVPDSVPDTIQHSPLDSQSVLSKRRIGSRCNHCSSQVKEELWTSKSFNCGV